MVAETGLGSPINLCIYPIDEVWATTDAGEYLWVCKYETKIDRWGMDTGRVTGPLWAGLISKVQLTKRVHDLLYTLRDEGATDACRRNLRFSATGPSSIRLESPLEMAVDADTMPWPSAPVPSKEGRNKY